MPIKVVRDLPAIEKLSNENIFVMDERRAEMQDFRELEILIVNLMPTKEATEEQLLRLLSNSPLQIKVTFLRMASHHASNVSQEHLANFYRTFDDIKDQYFDGLIVTGAPVEHLEFETVNYWQELQAIMNWSKNHVFAELFICWGAQAALYHRYGIEKYPLNHKLFGIYDQYTLEPKAMLMRGFDEVFLMPHSRHTEVLAGDIEASGQLEILVSAQETGPAVVHSRDHHSVYVFGHMEYDAETLGLEYQRDLASGQDIQVPYNYYPEDYPQQRPLLRWRSAANLLVTNWLNYYVYQSTPFVIEKIKDHRD
ncbi:homoserine O-succinyltransferase [Aerococcus urinaehominis]|uniref:Homoserine O-acetyltransferase n=1 Tax=Aerococcus urinaehominis TaxID=128944 RepID=A0A0X8FM71_9LACT|nr:homoserine O-succinyltransferase [Aerococcus urinaehominis]AMB99634.1 homoserine O-succinyltransferase [Aerococcus urinaehominis]SDL88308.1 homoserine O-succinyltransferase [Aerococcus urinaehominis]